MASIRYRLGKWAVQVRKQGHGTVNRTFGNKANAQRWARSIEADIESGVFQDIRPAHTTSFAELLKQYQTEVLPTKKSQRSVVSQIALLTRDLGTLSLLAITPARLSAFRDLRLSLVGPETVRKDLLLVSRVCNTATKDWGIHLPHGNPVEKVRLPKPPRGRDRRLEAGEEQSLLHALRFTKEVQVIVSLAVETAMRRSELTGLQWEDIDWDRQTAYIPETKTDRPREIPLTERAIELLSSLKGSATPARVFTIHAGSITQAFARACRRVGLENLTFHDLRHEATSRFFEKGLNPMEVAFITGHQDLRMLRRYTHLRAEDLARKLRA
jgi:integrase